MPRYRTPILRVWTPSEQGKRPLRPFPTLRTDSPLQERCIQNSRFLTHGLAVLSPSGRSEATCSPQVRNAGRERIPESLRDKLPLEEMRDSFVVEIYGGSEASIHATSPPRLPKCSPESGAVQDKQKPHTDLGQHNPFIYPAFRASARDMPPAAIVADTSARKG